MVKNLMLMFLASTTPLKHLKEARLYACNIAFVVVIRQENKTDAPNTDKSGDAIETAFS